jgi:hypothetical protein
MLLSCSLLFSQPLLCSRSNTEKSCLPRRWSSWLGWGIRLVEELQSPVTSCISRLAALSYYKEQAQVFTT